MFLEFIKACIFSTFGVFLSGWFDAQEVRIKKFVEALATPRFLYYWKISGWILALSCHIGSQVYFWISSNEYKKSSTGDPDYKLWMFLKNYKPAGLVIYLVIQGAVGYAFFSISRQRELWNLICSGRFMKFIIGLTSKSNSLVSAVIGLGFTDSMGNDPSFLHACYSFILLCYANMFMCSAIFVKEEFGFLDMLADMGIGLVLQYSTFRKKALMISALEGVTAIRNFIFWIFPDIPAQENPGVEEIPPVVVPDNGHDQIQIPVVVPANVPVEVKIDAEAPKNDNVQDEIEIEEGSPKVEDDAIEVDKVTDDDSIPPLLEDVMPMRLPVSQLVLPVSQLVRPQNIDKKIQ